MVAIYNFSLFADICNHVSLECASAGTRLLKCGDVPRDCYVIVSGQCRAEVQYSYIKNGKKKTKVKFLSTMSKRTLFGELSLIFEQTRTATVIATQPTMLLVIPGEVFKTCMKSALLSKINTLIEFYKQLKYLKTIPDSTLMLLASRSYMQTLQPTTVVAIQDQPCKKAYFVKNGRVKVVREMEVYEYKEQATFENYEEAYKKPSKENDGTLTR